MRRSRRRASTRLRWVTAASLVMAACALLGIAAPARAVERIFLVRHAEKAEGWPSAPELDALWPLGAQGQARAERLASALADSGIAAVYATATTRAISTGLPLASRLECPLRTYPATTDSVQLSKFIARLLAETHNARAVLLVGHSNTIPALLRALGESPQCDAALGIAPESWGPGVKGYDGLWVDLIRGRGCARFQRLALP